MIKFIALFIAILAVTITIGAGTTVAICLLSPDLGLLLAGPIGVLFGLPAGIIAAEISYNKG